MEAKVWNHSQWIYETSPKVLKAKFDKLLKDSGFSVLNFVEHNFSPQGWTAMWLLAESHLAIHTFPEHGKAYIEITSCMLGYFIEFLKKIEGVEVPKNLPKKKKKGKAELKNEEDVVLIIEYLNAIAGKKYSTDNANRKMIDDRLEDGYSIEQCMYVIDVKSEGWKGTDMDKYLRIETLFRPSHFESYLNEKQKSQSVKITTENLNYG